MKEKSPEDARRASNQPGVGGEEQDGSDPSEEKDGAGRFRAGSRLGSDESDAGRFRKEQQEVQPATPRSGVAGGGGETGYPGCGGWASSRRKEGIGAFCPSPGDERPAGGVRTDPQIDGYRKSGDGGEDCRAHSDQFPIDGGKEEIGS